MGGFFKLPQYNVFDFKPRFYDPEKEERKEKLNDLRLSNGKASLDSEDQLKPGDTIKGGFRTKMKRTAYRSRNSTIRFLVILSFLIFLVYIIFVADLTSLIKLFAK